MVDFRYVAGILYLLRPGQIGVDFDHRHGLAVPRLCRCHLGEIRNVQGHRRPSLANEQQPLCILPRREGYDEGMTAVKGCLAECFGSQQLLSLQLLPHNSNLRFGMDE